MRGCRSSSGERLARLPAINPAFIRAMPPAPAEGDITRLTIGTLEGRPVFRVTARGRTELSFADTGDAVPAVDADQALRIARAFDGGINDVRYDARLTDADQWSFGVRGRMPLHRIAVEDAAGTRLYVTENGGEVVLKTTASGRFWGWAGAVLHWLYFAPLRRNAALWNEVIVWTSIAGTVMCLAGIAVGTVAARAAARLSAARSSSMVAVRRLDALASLRGPDLRRRDDDVDLQRAAVDGSVGLASQHRADARSAIARGRRLDRADRSLRRQAARARSTPSRPIIRRRSRSSRFRGRYYAIAARRHRVVRRTAVRRSRSTAGRSDRRRREPGDGRRADRGHHLARSDYDAYYYDRDRRVSLPVLRVRYGDPQQTWLYFDPKRGAIARKEERLTRLNRWLYHGLHSLDFPFLYYRRPLWDIVVIVLSIGGIVLSATTLTASWRRVRRICQDSNLWIVFSWLTSGPRS